jgi:hypothetical protein
MVSENFVTIVINSFIPVFIIFQVTNAFSYLGHKGCISMIKLHKITIAKKKSLCSIVLNLALKLVLYCSISKSQSENA